VLKELRRRTEQNKAYTLNAANRNRRISLQRPGRRAPLHETRSSNTSTPADTTTPCPRTRCARSSIPRRKCSADGLSRRKRFIPKLRPRSLKFNYGYGRSRGRRRPDSKSNKLICRQVATTWLDRVVPAQAGDRRKPAVACTPMSHQRNGKNLFGTRRGKKSSAKWGGPS